MAWPTPPATWSTNQVVTATDLNTQLRDALNAVLPVGTLILRVAAYSAVEVSVEDRWLQCNGVAVSRTTYSVLFNYLNSLSPALPFGVGNGSTTFNLPDTRGRTAYAQGTHADVDAMGDSEGAALASRTPHHDHELAWGFSVGSGSSLARGASTDGTYGAGALGEGAYLVAGSYFIKYTS